MTQVNLLPAEVGERTRVRRLTIAIVSAVGAVVALLLFVLVLQGSRLSAAQRDLAKQQAGNASLQSRIVALQPFRQLQQAVAAKQALITQITQGQVPWSGVLKDVSTVIPGRVWLTNMTGALNTATPVAQTGGSTATPTPAQTLTGSGIVGSLQFQGAALDHASVALWLDRLTRIDGWVNPWISTSSSAAIGTTTVVNFSGTVDLTSAATSPGRVG